MTVIEEKFPQPSAAALIQDCNTGYLDHAVRIVKAFYFYQCDRRKIFSEYLTIRVSQRLLVVPISLQIGNIDRQNRILIWMSPGSFDGCLKISHHLRKLRNKIAFANHLAVGIEWRLPGDVDDLAVGDFSDVSVADRFLQTFWVQQFKSHRSSHLLCNQLARPVIAGFQ